MSNTPLTFRDASAALVITIRSCRYRPSSSTTSRSGAPSTIRRPRRLHRVFGGERDLDRVLDHGDLRGVREALGHELSPERARRAVRGRHHKRPFLVHADRRHVEHGDTREQLDPALPIAVAHRDRAGGAEFHRAAVGQHNALLRAWRRSVIGHQQHVGIAQPQGSAPDHQYQAGRQRGHARVNPAQSGASNRFGAQRVRCRGDRRGNVIRKRAHLGPRRPGLAKRGRVPGALLDPPVESPLFGVTQCATAKAHGPGGSG